MPKFSGHPPFAYFDVDEYRPIPQENCIKASFPSNFWMPVSNDFWRICLDGRGFMLCPMEEDEDGYMNNVYSRPKGRFFNWLFPIYRMTEILEFIEALAKNFSNENASFHLIINYHGTRNRQLQQSDSRYRLPVGSVCRSDSLNSSIKEQVTKIETNIEELVLRLLIPIYEQFDFTQLPPMLVKNVVKEALNY